MKKETITVVVQYYRRREDFTPIYSEKIIKEFSGNTAEECMEQYRQFSNNHDCRKYTTTEIINVYQGSQI